MNSWTPQSWAKKATELLHDLCLHPRRGVVKTGDDMARRHQIVGCVPHVIRQGHVEYRQHLLQLLQILRPDNGRGDSRLILDPQHGQLRRA